MNSTRRVSAAACLLGATLLLLPPVTTETSMAETAAGGPPMPVVQAAVHAVSVTPDAATAPERAADTGGHTATFTVTNTGTEPDTYELGCMAIAKVRCEETNPTRLTLDAGQSAAVDVTYEVGAPGAGLLSLVAFTSLTRATDSGSYRVPVRP